MRSRAPLAMAEQAIMLLAFAFAAAICLQAFAYCHNTSKRTEMSGRAATAAASVADAVKAGDGEALRALGIDAPAGVDVRNLPLDGADGLYLELRYGDRSGKLWTATITVSDKDGNELSSLDIAGQVVDG